jgi:hypothetical protein
MGNIQKLKEAPLKMAFTHGFLYVETDKNVYYPGETINGTVHLLLNKPIISDEGLCVSSLDIKLKGKETFKFTATQNQKERSCRGASLIFDNKFTLCNFHNETV